MFVVDCVLPYFSIPFLIAGIAYRLWRWFKIPLPLRIGLAPIPKTNSGILGSIIAEVFIFRTLFKSERSFWFVIWSFHIAGLLTIGNHLLGLVDGLIEAYSPDINTLQIKVILFILGFVAWILIGLLLYILIRRFYKIKIREMSFFTDYVAVILILGLVSAGAYMAFFTETDMVAVARWGTGLFTLTPETVDNPVFSIHFLFAQVLFIYFPFSKLFHPLGQIASRMMTTKEEQLNPEGVAVK